MAESQSMFSSCISLRSPFGRLNLPRPYGPMAGNLRLEIAEARPIEPLVQVHFRDRHSAPLLRLGEHFAFAVVNRRDHPVARRVGVSAADEIDVIFTRPGGDEQWVAAPNREGDHFCAAVAQL